MWRTIDAWTPCDSQLSLRHAIIDVMNWAEFERAAPELAALGRAGFGKQNLCLIGTLRADGWPRISAQELYIVDGELLLGMMRKSRKSLDLERDPRITVMTPQADREATTGDFKLYGRAVAATAPALREAYGKAVFAAIDWRPKEPYPLWAVHFDSAAYISFGDNHRLIRWTSAGGVEELRHPDDVPGYGAAD